MRISSERILTTHVGSLPRPQAVADLLLAEERGELSEHTTYHATMSRAVQESVAKQLAVGVDVPGDGEISKIG